MAQIVTMIFVRTKKIPKIEKRSKFVVLLPFGERSDKRIL